jgi:hypothetical protein
MSLSSKVKKYSNVAVFARNWPHYLKKAAEIALSSPNQPVTFRAQTIWKSAENAISAHGPRKIYFSPNGSEGIVEYEAILEQVALYPGLNTQATKELLDNCLTSTSQEGLWGGSVKTLYVISHCTKLEEQEQFPQSELKKVSDGQHISEGYTRAYVIVFEHQS